ncbi:MAG TPA: SPFH domain-containing protein [Planctomycetota bacterium]|nr:SPFH domain-containing protein [Planctomycetota bacterium]
MKMKIVLAIPAIVILIFVGMFVWNWIFCYKWCPYGYSLQVSRKTGKDAPTGQYAEKGEKGVMEQLRGPGRYLDLNPWTYDVEEVRDVLIPAGEILLVKNNIGKDLPPGRFLAGPDEKGLQEAVLTPGAWRINRFGQKIIEASPGKPQLTKATIISPGYVGVQTLREGKGKGVLDTVLTSGYYNINPEKIRVDCVEVGYRVWDIATEYENVNIEGTTVQHIVEGSGVSFPLADGKQMHLDFTVVWGIFPENAPRIIRKYGTVAMVESKVIEPQVLSICKNAGSNLTTQQFIEGSTRERFQQEATEALKEMGEEKGINFLIALVRGFHPDEDIKATIQARMIAEEEKITLKFEQERDTVAAQLEKAERMVDIAIKDFNAETQALVQEERELGVKRAAEIRAGADRTVAGLKKSTAEIDAQIVRTLGQAEADVIEAKKRAEATRLELLIHAYGGAKQYNLATFAESLPEDIDIEYRYSGDGTFWTNSNASMVELGAKKVLQQTMEKEEQD